MVALNVQSKSAAAEIGVNGNPREMFYQLANPDFFPAVVPCAERRLRRLSLESRSDIPDDFRRAMEDQAFHADFTGWIPPPSCAKTGGETFVHGLMQLAPTAMTEFWSLRNVSAAANAHTEPVANLFSLYARLRRHGWQTRRVNGYCNLVVSVGLSMPPVTSRAFSQRPDFLEAAFEPALTQLGLASLPTLFLGELIGFTLAHLTKLEWLTGSAEYAAAKIAGLPLEYWECSLDASERKWMLETVRRAAAGYVCSHPPGCEEHMRSERIWAGFELYRLAELRLRDIVNGMRLPEAAAADQVIQIFRRKAHFAFGHHQQVRLAGRSLDSWFDEGLQNGRDFLDRLLDSPYFDRERPRRSRFFSQLCGPSGVMFGVFDDTEKKQILDWLLSGSNRINVVTMSEPGPVSGLQRPCSEEAQRECAEPDRRELYNWLVNIDEHREVLPCAQRYVDRQLRRTLWLSHFIRSSELVCFEYSEQAFDERINGIYESQMRAYRPVDGQPKISRDALIWGIEQFAPTILVDGCWLQGIVDSGNDQDQIWAALWSIYADEVGDGCVANNHANIYRTLLQSVEIELPELTSMAFCQHPGFLHSAFDLPVYLLAISRFPRQYIAEIIGLNLAIEISGLGAGYMRLVETLRYWEIDPAIVSLHLSIDNMASGHAAVARNVVKNYLDTVLLQSGPAAVQQHWRRIWTGYLSLRIVPARFSAMLVLTYLFRFGLRDRFWSEKSTAKSRK